MTTRHHFAFFLSTFFTALFFTTLTQARTHITTDPKKVYGALKAPKQNSHDTITLVPLAHINNEWHVLLTQTKKGSWGFVGQSPIKNTNPLRSLRESVFNETCQIHILRDSDIQLDPQTQLIQIAEKKGTHLFLVHSIPYFTNPFFHNQCRFAKDARSKKANTVWLPLSQLLRGRHTQSGMHISYGKKSYTLKSKVDSHLFTNKKALKALGALSDTRPSLHPQNRSVLEGVQRSIYSSSGNKKKQGEKRHKQNISFLINQLTQLIEG